MTGYKYGKQNQEYQILSVSMVVTALQKKNNRKVITAGPGIAAKQQFTSGTEKDINLGRLTGNKQAL